MERQRAATVVAAPGLEPTGLGGPRSLVMDRSRKASLQRSRELVALRFAHRCLSFSLPLPNISSRRSPMIRSAGIASVGQAWVHSNPT